MKESKKPGESKHPSDEYQYDSHPEHAPALPPESGEAKQYSAAHANQPKDADTKLNPADVSVHSKFWKFIIEPKHSNALIAIFTVLIFVAGALYTVFAALQWCAMRESNELNRGALTSVQRAFVYLEGFDVAPNIGSDGVIVGIRITPRWKNSGATRTVDAFAWSNFYWGCPPAGFDYPDYDDAGHVIPTKAGRQVFVPPQTTSKMTPHKLDMATLREIRNKGLEYRLYGWIKYRDVFSGTRMHTTRYCYSVAEILDTPTANGVPNIGLHPCQDEQRNCVDEGCR